MLWELTAWEYWPVFIVCVVASTPIAPYLKERLTAWVEGCERMSVLAPGGTAHPKTAAADLLCVTDAKPADARKAVIYQVVLTLWDVALLGLLALSAANVLSGSFNPFIYFQF